MERLRYYVIFSFFFLVKNNSIAFQWVRYNPHDAFPSNVIRINDREYVGRARHYDEVLVAGANSTAAVVSSCGEQIAKRNYELLVSREPCVWETFTHIEKIPKNIVQAGSAANGEPIYIGRTRRATANVMGIEPIYLLSKLKNQWTTNNIAALVCNDNANWVDTEATKIPNNSIEAGSSKFGKTQYVARLKLGCTIVPGNVIPELGIASAVYNDEEIVSPYCQVLVGEKNEYKWQLGLNGHIPDYSVVSSRERNGELMYVARINYTVGYLTQSLASNLNSSYEILVKNEQIYDKF